MNKQRLISILLALFLLASLLALPVLATDANAADVGVEGSVPVQDDTVPLEGYELKAKAGTLIDLNNGRTIYAKNTEEQVYPASLTKIMTCLVALENGNLSDIVTVSEGAMNGLDGNSSSAGLQIGEQLTLENMLYCLMLASGNEAANAVAEHVAGSVADFVRMMNERAYELGCLNTHFVNPHGLHDSEHYTTVSDLVKIVMAALKSETFKIITDTAEYTLPATNMSEERDLETTNQLINDTTSNPFYYSPAIGIKTGFTTPAGRCIISTAKRNGMYFLAVICGAETTILKNGETRMENFPECIRMFRYGFDNYAYVTMVSPLYPVAQITVKNSAASEVVSLSPEEDIRLLMPVTYDPALVRIEPDLTAQFTEAPVSAGQVFGTVSVYYEEELLGTTQLCAINDVARAELPAATAPTTEYVQSSWWQWVVAVIVLVLVGVIVMLVVLEVRRRQARRRRMEARRRALEERQRRMREYDHFDDFT